MKARFLILFLLLTGTVQLLVLPTGTPTWAAQSDNVCVVLILDESGSMAESDAAFLRNAGGKLMLSVLDEGDRVGIVRFSTGARRLTPELVTLGGPEDKSALLALLDDVPPDGFTDMQAALSEARALLEGAGCDNAYIVFLSDGHPELENGLPENYEADSIALVQSLNVPVYGIALTTEGESGLLYQLASATTPVGRVIPARTASDLLDAYLEVVAHLKDRTVIGSGFTSAPGRAMLPLELGLAQYVSRVTYLVSKSEHVTTQLTAPGGEFVAAGDQGVVFAYTDDPRFSVYTIEGPAPGDWGWLLNGDGQVQARAILRSKLRVVSSEPAAYHPQGQPMLISASLIEEESDGTLTTLIGQASFSAFITRPDGSQDELDRLYDDGTHGDRQAGDGVFSGQYVKSDLLGEYAITLTGYKGTIPAMRTVRVMVVQFPQIEILAPTAARVELRGDPLVISMSLQGGDPPTLDAGSFVAEVTGPDGRTFGAPLTQRPDGLWTGVIQPQANGSHAISIAPREAFYKGTPYTLSAGTTVEIILVPAIRLALRQGEILVAEVAEVTHGITLIVDAYSTSSQAEDIDFEVAGIPGLTIGSVTPEGLPPGESAIYVNLQGQAPLGDSHGKLLAGSRQGVDLDARELPFVLHVYQPALLATPDVLTIQVRHDRQDEGEHTITVASESMKDETVTAVLRGLDGLTLEADPVTVTAGESAQIPFHFTGELDEGQYEGAIQLIGRNGVEMKPAIIPVTLVIEPTPWCARWCAPLAGVCAVALFAVVLARRAQLRRPRPYGILQPVKAPLGHPQPAPAALASRKGQVTIGSGRNADIRLSGGSVQDKHAAILARQETVTERVGQPPRLVEVKKVVNVARNLGHGRLVVNGVNIVPGQESAPLQAGARIGIGEYEFVYRL